MKTPHKLMAIWSSVRCCCTVAVALLSFSGGPFALADAPVEGGDKQERNAEKQRIAFYSFGQKTADKTNHARIVGFINEDGSGERFLDFGLPVENSWLLGPQFADGRRMIVTSFEDATLSKVRGLGGEVRFQTWIQDVRTDKLTKILDAHDLPRDTRPAVLLPGEKRLVVAATNKGAYSVLEVDLDGGNPVELVGLASGFAYAMSLSPDGNRLAFHITGGQWGNLKKPSRFALGHYNINVLDLKTHERVLVAGAPGHLYFGPQWSPDGQSLAYLDCHVDKSPNHFRGDVCVGKVDGTENRVLTENQPHWFGANWGTSEYSSGGSNMVSWSPDGTHVLFTRVFGNMGNDQSRGGSQLCLVDPVTRETSEVTSAEESLWVHHATWSRDGHRIVYSRAKVGEPSELWTVNRDSSGQRMLTKGYKQRGVDLGGRFLTN